MQLILLTLAPLLAFALAENVQANITNITNITTPKQVGKPIVCKVKRVRKEVREMKKDGDFEGFVKAFNQLLVEGEMGKFESIHVNDWDYKHMSPRFLPWHRMFLHDLEEKLIARGAKYLPYWDWYLSSTNAKGLLMQPTHLFLLFGALRFLAKYRQLLIPMEKAK